jgi:hypothetical protein
MKMTRTSADAFNGAVHGAERATKGNEEPARGEDAADIEGSGGRFLRGALQFPKTAKPRSFEVM